MMKNLVKTALLLIGLFAGAVAAQTVKGVVKDQTGEVLPGVAVQVVGTTSGVTTNIDGNYEITVPDTQNSVLRFSFMGMKPVEIAVVGKTSIDVTMESEQAYLEEMVVIGYGVVKKSDLTGSVASIKADDIQKVAASNAIQSMQAKVPGLDIQQSSGQAGSSISMNLRGNRSISASNSPLILVDGVEYGSTLDINPSDIESMEILKDASSTAIYGTRGANGVIIITTKRGAAGKTQVNFSAYASSNIPTNVPKVMYGRKEVQRLIDKANYQADLKSGDWGSSNVTAESVLSGWHLVDETTAQSIYDDGSYTDWADEILQSGLTQNYELSVSGGSDKTNFSLSLGAMKEEGLLKNDALDRYNVKTNLDHKVSDIFKVGTSLLYTYKNHDKRNANVFSQSMKMTTITHAYLNDGTINYTPNPWYVAHCNPLLDEVSGAYQNNIESTRFFGNAYLQITPMKGLVFKTMYALDRQDTRTGLYQDYQSVGRFQSPTTSYLSSTKESSTAYTWDNTLTYNSDFNGSDHDMTVLLGTSATQSLSESLSVAGDCGEEHYKLSSFYDVLKITSAVPASAYTKQSMFSYFGRLNYKFKDKYLLTASLRADGSSVLADGNKWGYFPSVSAAWRIGDEDFMSVTSDWLSNLKLRASWGIAGNAAVSPYKTKTILGDNYVYYNLSGEDVKGKIPSVLGNSDLSWETTRSFDFGVDFGIIDNRVSGSIDFYVTKTSDLLYLQTASLTTSYPTCMANVGSSKGRGLEISLNTLAVDKGDFKWDINWSYATSRDEITELTNGLEKNVSGSSAHIVGEPISIYYDYETTGCWNVGEYEEYIAAWQERHSGEAIGYESEYGKPGTLKIVDRNDDGIINSEDKRVYERSPKHIFGMNNNFSYKNWNLGVLLYARLGGYISYDMNSQLNYETANWGDLDYWTMTNTGGRFPNPGANATIYTNYGGSLKYEKADYIKIKDITLSYNLPKEVLSHVGLGSMKVYGSLKNFFTFSDIENYDPERGGAISFPLAKQVVFGLNIQF